MSVEGSTDIAVIRQEYSKKGKKFPTKQKKVCIEGFEDYKKDCPNWNKEGKFCHIDSCPCNRPIEPRRRKE